MAAVSRRRTVHGHARVKLTGGTYRPTIAPPTPAPGQVACPVCRRPVRLTSAGYLRGHTDLFGHHCYNRRSA